MNIQIISVIVIVFSWWLNAYADAINFSKPKASLYLVWHIVDNLSFFLPYLLIIYLVGLDWYFIVLGVILMIGWYPIYSYSRKSGFWKLDNLINIKWLNWIWSIERDK